MNELKKMCDSMFEQAHKLYDAIKLKVSEMPSQIVVIDNEYEPIEVVYLNVNWRIPDYYYIYGIRVKDDELEICFCREILDEPNCEEEWYSLQDHDNICFVQTLFDIADKLDCYLDSSDKPL